jgi:arylsulfatase A
VEGTSGHPNHQGFDEWFGYLDQGHAHFHYTDHLWKNRAKVTVRPDQYTHDLFTTSALDFIQRHGTHPFFLYLAFTIPHASMEVPEDSLRKFQGEFPEKPFKGPHYRAQDSPNAAFAAMMDRLDDSVGRILSLLKEMDLDDRTLTLFSSDNGPHREGGHEPDFFRSSGPLRGIKRDLYEGGIRVPLVVRWPDRIRAGAVADLPMAFWDILPTAAELAGVSPPKEIDGLSMVPLLMGRVQKEHEFLYWEFFERGFQQAVRIGDWKALRLGVKQPLELYDLRNDMSEQNDLADQQPEFIAKIEAFLKTVRTESKFWPVKGDS